MFRTLVVKMARYGYIPEKQPQERRFGRDDPGFQEDFTPDPERKACPDGPWMHSVEEFVQDKLDNDEDYFTGAELQALSGNVRLASHVVRAKLEGFGLKVQVHQSKTETFRTFGDNPHNRWTGSEQARMSGGSGGSNIMGFVS